LTKSLSNDNFLLAKVKKIFRKKKGAIMKRTAKLRKIFATITDIFIFSVLVRVIFYGCLQSEGQMQLSLFLSLLIGGFVNYVLIPFYLKSRTLGMKMNGLVYKFVKKTNLENFVDFKLTVWTAIMFKYFIFRYSIGDKFIFDALASGWHDIYRPTICKSYGESGIELI
jgi:hypothetical protein